MNARDFVSTMAALVVLAGALHIISKRDASAAQKGLTVIGAVLTLGTLLEGRSS